MEGQIRRIYSANYMMLRNAAAGENKIANDLFLKNYNRTNNVLSKSAEQII